MHEMHWSYVDLMELPESYLLPVRDFVNEKLTARRSRQER